ncbi:MAG: type II secretion system F family protein [Deltaproteobacteria bacterium]|nr:type II secretion system F family protein [Deltaproteobacteria bacterium]
MATFEYTAYTAEGTAVKGERESATREALANVLRSEGLVPVRVLEVRQGRTGKGWPRRRPGLADVEALTANLAMLLAGGVRPERAIDVAKRATAHPALREIMDRVHRDVRGGESLAGAMGKSPECFDSLYVSVVAIGESTGDLAQAFQHLADNLAFRREVGSRTREALVYPAVVACVCVLTVIFIFYFLVPRFAVMFEGTADLPAYTRALLATSEFVHRYGAFALLSLVAAAFLTPRLVRVESARHALQRIGVAVPGLNRIVLLLETLRFSTAMAILLRSGVSLVEALEHATLAVSNKFVRARLTTVRRDVRDGQPLSRALAAASVLPELYLGIIEAAEESGRLGEVFADVRTRLKQAFEAGVRTALTILEPAMIVVMGLVVGSIVVVLMLSMVSVVDVPL